MRVGAVQFKARATVADGLDALVDLLVDTPPTDLLVLPEMALHGYAFADAAAVRAVAERPQEGTFSALSTLARVRSTWLVAGFPERAGTVLHNAARVIRPDGTLAGVVRKHLLFEADQPWASPGDNRTVFDTGAGRFAVGICMDLNDDRFLAWVAEASPDVLALPTNWIQEDGGVWDYWRFRLQRGWPEGWVDPLHTVTDRAPVDALLVGANGYGVEGAYVLRGESAILDHTRVYAAADATGDALLVVDTAPVVDPLASARR
jgi:predicted amidohydrolase